MGVKQILNFPITKNKWQLCDMMKVLANTTEVIIWKIYVYEQIVYLHNILPQLINIKSNKTFRTESMMAKL